MKQSSFHIKTKLVWLGLGSVLISLLVIVITVSFWQMNLLHHKAQLNIKELAETHLSHMTENLYNMIRSCDESLQQEVDSHLKVAHYIFNKSGKIQLSKETVDWVAVNQLTHEPLKMTLPKMMVGNTWLTQNNQVETRTPIIDDITEMLGNTVTLFQRINGKGDMLGIATSVRAQNGKRAIGTYIPALKPDGSANDVVASLLDGKTYHGMAFVVDAWYVAAYEPIYGNNGMVIGALYTGIKQEHVTSLRQAILQTKVGKTGYVYVLGGKGQHRGHYIISKDGQRDGEDIWTSIDNSGRFFIQSIINKALLLRPGELATERYRWQNLGEAQPRWKIVRFAYYAPWDWVIGVSIYEDELQNFSVPLTESSQEMIQIISLVAIGIVLLVGGIIWFLARSVVKFLQQIRQSSKQMVHEIINFFPEAAFMIDLEGRIILWNRSIEEMTGIEAKDILGKNNYEHALPFYGERRPMLVDLLNSSQEELDKKKYVSLKKEGDTLIGETDTFYLSKARKIHLYEMAKYIYDSQGHLIGALGNVRNLA